jgi:E3 ubiquitin-protein ligase NRDP1
LLSCQTLRLDALQQHEAACEANPARPVACEKGCGLTIPADETAEHNCVKALRELVLEQKGRLASLEERVANQATCISNQASREHLCGEESSG